MTNPYLLELPAIVSFSGGRTSGYMAKHIADAHDAAGLERPAFVYCNTGKEREETLAFVDECDRRWGLNVRWLEYRREEGRHTLAEVHFATASRKGEPFEAVCSARGFVPNKVARFCTVELKARTSNRFVRRVLGWKGYRNAIGLRADEMDRVARLLRPERTVTVEQSLFGEVRKVRRGTRQTGEVPICPLADAGVSEADVLAWWAVQPFDLALRQDEGNCDLCFLKGAGKLARLIQERPESADWWIAQEERMGATFVDPSRRPDYATLRRIALEQVPGPGWLFEEMWARPGCDEGRCTD